MEDSEREVIFSVVYAKTEYVFVVTDFDTVGKNYYFPNLITLNYL